MTLGAGIKHLGVPPAEAAEFLAIMLGWNGGKIPVFVDGRQTPDFMVACGPRAGERLWRRAEALELGRSAQVEIGLPVVNGGVSSSTVLWCWCDSRDSSWRASRFQPAPALVLRFGASAQRLCLWGLREAVPWPSIEPHNGRLSYALRAPRTRCEAEQLRVPMPGTFLRVGRSRPVPVMVTRMEMTGYTRSQVTSQLKDAPSRDAWRQRKSA